MATQEKTTWHKYDRRTRLRQFAWLLFGLIIVILFWRYLAIRVTDFQRALPNLHDLFTRMYPPDRTTGPDIIGPLIETVHIAVVGTVIGLFMSLPVALLAAENTTPFKLTYYLGKLIVVVTRSVHSIVWAMLFVLMFGPGALAGTAAISIRSVGFIGKLLGEEIEEIDYDQVEAIHSTGAQSLSVLLWGIFPQVKPALVGITVYRWDINVRHATIVGIVGAGGIGVELFTAVDFLAWREVATIVLAILAIVMFSEVLSAWARRKVR